MYLCVFSTDLQNELRCEDVALLTAPTKAGDVPDESSAPVVSAGTCFDFNQTSEHLFLVGECVHWLLLFGAAFDACGWEAIHLHFDTATFVFDNNMF